MSDDIVLTIGIPVHNGGRMISRTLESVRMALEDADRGAVEVLVSDNASADGTERIVRDGGFSAGMALAYYRNDRDEGFDRNVDLVVDRAGGRYVWLLGCGEVVKPGAVSLILKMLRGRAYNNVVVNCDIYSERLGGVEEENNLGLSGDMVFRAGDEFFSRLIFAIGPLSCNIILKESWLAVRNKPLAQFGFCHVERIMNMIALREGRGDLEVLVIGAPCFTMWRETGGWWERPGLMFTLCVAMRGVIMNMPRMGYSRSTADLLLREGFKGLVSSIRLGKSQGMSVSRGLIVDSMRSCRGDVRFWLLYLPLLLMPRSIYLAAKRIWKAAEALCASPGSVRKGRSR